MGRQRETCISHLSHTVINNPDKSKSEKNGFVWACNSGEDSIMEGKGTRQNGRLAWNQGDHIFILTQEVEPSYKTLKPTPSNVLPSTRFNLVKVV